MSKSKLEYIWLDGYKPTQNMRSKTKVLENFSGKLEDCPVWSFDGSSTKQAEGGSSDCLLKPVAIYTDPDRVNGFLVMTEVLNADGSPHESNARATIDDDDNDFWFGFEQEYFIMDCDTLLPLGFPVGGYPGPQGMYYCSVGGKNTHGRDLVEEHADQCIAAGLNFEGINQEVASGQWEFQLFAKGAKKAGDEINKLRKDAPAKINKIAIETASELTHKLIGAEVNNSSISAIVDDLSKRNGDKYYGN